MPAAKAPSPERRVLTDEELEKMKERLCRLPKPRKAGDDHLLAPHTKIAEDDLAKQIARLYDQSIETKKRKLEKAKAAETKDLPPMRKLSEDELNESVTRQYTQALNTRHVNQERLKKKFQFNQEEMRMNAHRTAVLTPRTKGEVKALGARLHDECVAKKQEKMDKLFEKYINSTGPKKTVISTEEAREAAERLCTPRGGGGEALTPRRK